MSEARPRLVALPEPPERARPPAPRRSRRGIWLLVALAVVCASGWGLAQRRSERLARELAAAQDELSVVQARLATLEAQRSEVHAQVEALSGEASALSGHLSELEATLARDRSDASDAQLPRSEPSEAE